MDDTSFGTRDKRGDWKPLQRIEYPPVFVWPPRLLRFLRWLPAYVLPWNLFYGAVAVLLWLFLTPPMAAMQSFAPGWVAYLLARNAVLVLLVFGGLHLLLYVRRSQGHSFKFNGRWPSTDSPVFLFRNQTAENMFWALASGVPIWTAYEAVTLWAYANGYLPAIGLAEHPVYGVALFLLIPIIRDLHFYLVHRLIHWPPLYRSVHRLHHNNVNPAPWSGLSMHPVEHLLYFSGVLLHWIVPSHPVHALFHLAHAALSPAQGHTGYDRIVLGSGRAVGTESYAHYLHHKYFECNYADGVIPLDKWFGSFHDGTPEAQEAMDRRFRARHAKAAGGPGAV